MARKKKKIEHEQYFDKTGQLRFIVTETFVREDNRGSWKEEIRGFWTGEPHKSCFFALPEVADKRGITPSLKRRVRAEMATLAALREAYRHPITPDAEMAAKHRLAPSERTSCFEWGTLDWYRNELALAQDRIRLLEGERESLAKECDTLRQVVAEIIEAPGRASRGHAQSLRAEKERDSRNTEIKTAADAVLRSHPNIPRANLATRVKPKTNYSTPTVRRALRELGYLPKKKERETR